MALLTEEVPLRRARHFAHRRRHPRPVELSRETPFEAPEKGSDIFLFVGLNNNPRPASSTPNHIQLRMVALPVGPQGDIDDFRRRCRPAPHSVPTELVAEGSFSGRLNRVQIRISTAGALTAKLAWNAKYIGVAQQPAIIRRVFEASVSLIGRRRSAPRKSADPASRWAEL